MYGYAIFNFVISSELICSVFLITALYHVTFRLGMTRNHNLSFFLVRNHFGKIKLISDDVRVMDLFCVCFLSPHAPPELVSSCVTCPYLVIPVPVLVVSLLVNSPHL